MTVSLKRVVMKVKRCTLLTNQNSVEIINKDGKTQPRENTAKYLGHGN